MSMKISDFKDQFEKYGDSIMPALFVGHGNPMNAIEDNEFSREWAVIGKELPLAEAAEAHRAVLQPGAFGKIVLIP